MYNRAYELIYINRSRREVLVPSIMEILQVMYVKAKGVGYIYSHDNRTKRFGSKI